MHPLVRNKWWLIAYIPCWWLFAVMVAEVLRVPGKLSWSQAISVAVPSCTFYAFVCMAPWYIARPLLRQGAPYISHVVQHGGGAILATALWLGAAQGLAAFRGLGTELTPAIPVLISIGFLLYCLAIAVHYGLLAVESSREAAVQARDAELRALKAQIQPHFLFNSLNSIAALTSTDPRRARDMAILLSDFLRKTLGLGEKTTVPLGDELELTRTYLEVERVRFGSRLNVEMYVEGGCETCQVPPLVLQPLIENAIRHGIASLVDGGTVRVHGKVETGILTVRVENAFDPESPSARRHGHGLRNVRERLGTRFGTAATFVTSAEDSKFIAEMRIPCQRIEKDA